jgi:peptide/nickel transport system substrate-binding protein
VGRLTNLIAVIALVAVACTPKSGLSTTTTGGAVTSTTSASTTTTAASFGGEGEVVIGVGLAVVTLNPFADDAFSDTRLVGQAVWATIYDIEPETWERIPDIVTSLPSQTDGAIEVAENGSMTVRYELARGATWSDGTPITGADIAFTAQAMAQLALSGSQGIDPIMATVTATDSVERIAWITFSEASLAFEDALWVILPSHAIDQVAELKVVDGMDWPAGGPFMLADDQSEGELVLVRNPHYWKTDAQGNQLPYLNRLSILSAGEPGSEVVLFTDGSADVIVAPTSPDSLDAIDPTALDGVEVQHVSTPFVEHLTFQFGTGRDEINPESFNDSLDYRRAVAYSIDRPTLLIETGVPWIRETPGMLSPLGPSAWDVYPYDVAAGRESLQAVFGPAGRARPPTAVLSTTGNGDYRIRIGDALVGTLEAVGIDLETSYLDSLIFFGEQLGKGEFDIGMWAWVSDGGYASQLGLMELLDPASEASDANFGNWGVGESASSGTVAFSELVAEARSTIDPGRFAEIVERAEELLAEYLPLIPLFRRSSAAAIWTDSVAGVVHNGSKSEITWNVETWQKPAG